MILAISVGVFAFVFGFACAYWWQQHEIERAQYECRCRDMELKELRNEIANTCNSLMIDLISKRAIYDYLVVCDLSNNTPARIDRNELWVDIAIEPVKAVEFIYIPLRIKNTGEISGAAA